MSCCHCHLHNYNDLIPSNKVWAKEVSTRCPGFFEESAKDQKPNTLWIGCADSRVPASTVTASRPGSIFTHRNIANQFREEDVNGSAVVDYAVAHLKVANVIVVGHSGCGGIKASLAAINRKNFKPVSPIVTLEDEPANSPLNLWLAPLTLFAYQQNLVGMPIEKALPILVQKNVENQIQNLAKSQVIIKAGQNVKVHGWVYDLKTGLLEDLEGKKVQ